MDPITLLVLLGIGTFTTSRVIKNLYYICQPSEVLILAGTRSPVEGGKSVGYRLVKGGSSIRLPLLEEAFPIQKVEFRSRLKGLQTLKLQAKNLLFIMQSNVCWVKLEKKLNNLPKKRSKGICAGF
jgi:uncharacterized membrane protein YqiK